MQGRAWRISTSAAAAALVACGAAPAPIERDLDVTAASSATRERDFTLTWHGARVGVARERERWDEGGVTLERRERIAVRRGGDVIVIATAIDVRADRALRASRVAWREQHTTGGTRSGIARRDERGWRIELDGEPARRGPDGAVPEELVPLLARRDGHFAGDVLLTGRGLALAHGEVVTVGREQQRATLTLANGAALTAAITTDRDGDPITIVGSDGTVAQRADAAALAVAFDPPEVVDGAAIAIAGATPAGAVTLSLTGVVRAPPPALPGQRIVADGTTWTIALAPTDANPAAAPLVALVAAVFAEDAGGDCTAHALDFARRAAAAGLDARVVTGWRVDGGRLIRHRWALARSDPRGAWIAIDPSYGEAPAAPRLIGLALSGAGAAELAAADLAFAGTEGAAAAITP